MPLKRIIYICTKNQIKLNEFKRAFAQYGIIVKQCDEIDTSLLVEKTEGAKIIRPLCIMKEKTKLFYNGTSSSSDAMAIASMSCTHAYGELTIDESMNYYPVLHVSTLYVHFSNKDAEVYESKTAGIIDFSKRTNDDNNVSSSSDSSSDDDIYDWDDIFVIEKTGKTYEELRRTSAKVSSRDMNISKYIKDHIYYKKLMNLKYFEHDQSEPIDFAFDPKKFILSIPQFNFTKAVNDDNTTAMQHHAGMKKYKLQNIIINAVNQGVFFRAAKNRRQKLYWCPGLNAGIPYTKKPKDISHEVTYHFHDFTHFNIPDLVYTGGASDASGAHMQQMVYIGYRLISETVTLVMGDMIFVHSLMENGFTYETVNKRKLYPIFAAILRARNSSNDTYASDAAGMTNFICNILRGSFEYCFLGKIDRWENMMNPEDRAKVLEPFRAKYDAYFIEDARWSSQNYKNMASKNYNYAGLWNDVIAPNRGDMHLQSISEFIEEAGLTTTMNYQELMTAIFNKVLQKYIIGVLMKDINFHSNRTLLTRRFKRWAFGQMFVFYKYGDTAVGSNAMYYNILLNIIRKDTICETDIMLFRHYYKKYLDDLCDKRYISADDAATYEQVCPIFDAFIIDYDNVTYENSVFEYVKKFITQ